MATMPQDLVTFLSATTAITGLVGTTATPGPRIFYNHVPQQSVRPYVTFRTNSDDEELTMDGAGGLHEADIDLECAADTETASQTLADAVKSYLHGYKGTFGSHSAKGTFLTAKDDSYEPFSVQSDEGAHVVAYSVKLWYTS